MMDAISRPFSPVIYISEFIDVRVVKGVVLNLCKEIQGDTEASLSR